MRGHRVLKSLCVMGAMVSLISAQGCGAPLINVEPSTKRSKITLRTSIEPRRTGDPTRVSPEAERTPSGLRHLRLKAGTGEVHPGPSSTVKVNYIGWTDEGRVLDSSYQTGRPALFTLATVIKGWQEGVQLMVVGEKRRFWIPGKLAYADSPMSHVPKGMLTFDIELLGIEGE